MIKDKRVSLFVVFDLFLVGLFLFFFLQSNPTKKADPTPYLLSTIHNCEQQKNPSPCYKQLAHTLVQNYSLSGVFDSFEKTETQKEVYSSCHEILHYVGREEYQKVGNLKDALSSCSYVCFSGCLHGAVEGYALSTNLYADLDSNAKLINSINSICGKRNDAKQQEIYNQCVHGIGHALMFLTKNDLPRSLKLCDFLSASNDPELCYSGVFMENSTSSTNKDHPTKYVKADDPLYPCTILDEKYLSKCYELQSFTLLNIAGDNWEKAVNLCSTIPDAYRPLCYKSIASSQVNSMKDPLVLKKDCDSFKDNVSKEICIRSIVSTYSTRFGGDSLKIIRFCSNVDADQKKNCYSQMGSSLSGWTPDSGELAKLCGQIEEKQYVNSCEHPSSTLKGWGLGG